MIKLPGSRGATHVLGTGGGTKAGMTPAFDTPNVCTDKKLTDLKLYGKKEENNINQKQNVTANLLTEDEKLSYPVNKSLSIG